MNELIDVVHQIAESGLSPKEVKYIWFLVGIYNIIFVFFFSFNKKLYVVYTFYTMLCTCLVKTLYGINYNTNTVLYSF